MLLAIDCSNARAIRYSAFDLALRGGQLIERIVTPARPEDCETGLRGRATTALGERRGDRRCELVDRPRRGL